MHREAHVLHVIQLASPVMVPAQTTASVVTYQVIEHTIALRGRASVSRHSTPTAVFAHLVIIAAVAATDRTLSTV